MYECVCVCVCTCVCVCVYVCVKKVFRGILWLNYLLMLSESIFLTFNLHSLELYVY